MSLSTVNVGLAIEQRITDLKISKAEFGRRLGTTKQNAYRILQKTSCDTNDLVMYGEVLGFNFFTLFCEKELHEAKRNSNNSNINGLIGDNISINESIVGGTPDADLTIKNLRMQLAEEKEKSAKYWSVIENLTKK
jgi:hypothetical protein